MELQKSETAAKILALKEEYKLKQKALGVPMVWGLIPAVILVATALYISYTPLLKAVGEFVPILLVIGAVVIPLLFSLVWSFTPRGQMKNREVNAIAEEYRLEFLKFLGTYYKVDTNALDKSPDVKYVHHERILSTTNDSSDFIEKPNVLLDGRFKVDGTVLEGKFEKMGRDIILMHDGAEIKPLAA